MISIVDYIEWFVIALPLGGALVNGLLGKRLSRRAHGWIACGAVAGSLVAILPLLFGQAMEPGLAGRSKAFPWITMWTGDAFVHGPFRLHIDALSVFVALATIVTGLFIHLYIANTHNLDDDVSSQALLTLCNVALAALLLFELADNLILLLLGWSLSGWAVWALCHIRQRSWRFPALALLSDLALLFAVAEASPAFASLSLNHVLLAIPLATSTVPIEQVLPSIVALVTASALFRSAQFPFHLWVSTQDSDVPGIDAFLYALAAVPTGIILLARLYPLVLRSPAALNILSWWGMASALVMGLAAVAQQDVDQGIRYMVIGQGGLLLLALGQGIPLSALAFLPAYMLLQALLFLPGHHESRSTRWSLGFAAAALAGFPLLPGFFLTARLLLSTFERTALWICTALTSFIMAAAAVRMIRLSQVASRPAKQRSGRGLFAAMALGVVLLGVFDLTSPPLLALFLEPLFGASIPVPPMWFLIALIIIGGGTGLGYWLASKGRLPFAHLLNQVVQTRRLHRAAADLLTALSAFLARWEDSISRWTSGRLERWMLRDEDESRSS